ncbi:MAG: hypothetical protein EOM51_02690 [Clostridia bacterium]|nr:hypothetical protein [Clostridia bacterium]
MGQEPSSCDTTQIDAKFAPTRFTHHHACPRLITGGIPVEAYSSFAPFRFALGSPFTELSHASFTPPETLFGMTFAGYYSSSMVLDYGMIIGTGFLIVKNYLNFWAKSQYYARSGRNDRPLR